MLQVNDKKISNYANYLNFAKKGNGLKLNADQFISQSANTLPMRVNFKGIQLPIVIKNGKLLTNKELTSSLINSSQMSESTIRLILMIGGLALAPYVDLMTNKDLDDDTKNYSAVRIAVRQLVGGINGITARFTVEKLLKAAYGVFGTLKDGKIEKSRIDKFLESCYNKLNLKKPLLEVPEKYLEKPLSGVPDLYKGIAAEHINSTCQLFAIATGIATIFLLDAPLTSKVVNAILARLFPDRYKKSRANCPSQPNKVQTTDGGNK